VLQGTTKSVALILPEVKVPVLSLQSTLTQPRVSTASILRTSTRRRAICLEAIMRQTVTVGRRPSGTCAKKAVAAFSRISAAPRFRGEATLAAREKRPTATATRAMMCTKCSIWISSEERVREVFSVAAIWPRKVSSPVAKTAQSMRPCSTTVPQKATFRASTAARPGGASSALRGSATDSPVSAELSTSVPSEQASTRTSAGTFSPASRSKTSPGTSRSAATETSELLPPVWR